MVYARTMNMGTQSSKISNKILSTASYWAALLANQKSPKQIMVSIGIHHLSASKEIVTLLNKAGHGFFIQRHSTSKQVLGKNNYGCE